MWKYEDTIDVRDVIARVEELETEREDYENPEAWSGDNQDDAAELHDLEELLADLAGEGGDEEWRGDWYPILLIRDTYFKEYAMELAEEIDAIPDDAGWPVTCIDWDQAARELQMDYSAVEVDNITYLFR